LHSARHNIPVATVLRNLFAAIFIGQTQSAIAIGQTQFAVQPAIRRLFRSGNRSAEIAENAVSLPMDVPPFPKYSDAG
jgi:hypothetical protein